MSRGASPGRGAGVDPGAERAELAAEAARLQAEEGVRDWGFAKAKAAERLGRPRARAPSNAELAAALRSHLNTFAADEVAVRLAERRRLAQRLMRPLAAFQPHVAGALVHGLATPRSRIELHLFSDPAEQVDIALSDMGWHYEEDEVRLRHPDGRELIVPVCRLEIEDVEVDLLIFAEADRRWAPPCAVEGGMQRRVDPQALQALLTAAGD